MHNLFILSKYHPSLSGLLLILDVHYVKYKHKFTSMNPNEKNGYYFFAQKTGITLKIYKINFFAVN